MKYSPSEKLTVPQLVHKSPKLRTWSLEVHYRVHNSLPLSPLLSQINPLQMLQSYYFKLYFSTILKRSLGSPNDSFILVISIQCSPLHHTCHMPRPSLPPRSHHPNSIRCAAPTAKPLTVHISLGTHSLTFFT